MSDPLSSLGIPQPADPLASLGMPQAEFSAPLTEADAVAQAPNTIAQARQAMPQMDTNTAGAVYSRLQDGSSVTDRRIPQAASISSNVKAGQDAAAQGAITAAGVGTGALAGALQTAHTVGRVINKATGDKVTALPTSTDLPANLKPTNTSENVGATAENIIEFVSGDEFGKLLGGGLKGLAASAKYKQVAQVAEFVEAHPKLGRVMQIGINALRNGTTGAVQSALHGANLQDSLESGAAAGATGGVIEAAGEGVSAFKNAVSSSEVAAKGELLADSLSGGVKETPKTVASMVADHLNAAEDEMHDTYDRGLKGIAARAKNIQIPVQGSALQKAAQNLLTDTNLPEDVSKALKGVIPDADKLEPFLRKLASGTEEVETGLMDVNGNPITRQANTSVFDWDGMEATRQKIGQTYRKLPFDSPLRPELGKLRTAIDASMEEAATAAGKPDVAKDIRALRGDYAEKVQKFESTAIKTLRDKNPDAVADVLMGKQTVFNVNTLRSLIGEHMQDVEGSLFDKLFSAATSGGELNGKQFLRSFNKLGPDAQAAIWGDRLPEVKQFADLAGRSGNIAASLKPLLYTGGGTLAGYKLLHGDFKGSAEVVGAMAIGKLLANPKMLTAAINTLQAANKVGPAVAATATLQPEYSATHYMDPDNLTINPIK